MNILENSLLLFITIIHLIIILLVLIVPFTSSNYLLAMYVLIIPFIILHWIVGDNTCCLTVSEKYLRDKFYGKDSQESKLESCFTYKLIAPIYDFNKNFNNYSSFIYILTLSLWGIASFKLGNKVYNGEINSLHDLFTY